MDSLETICRSMWERDAAISKAVAAGHRVTSRFERRDGAPVWIVTAKPQKESSHG